MAAKCHRRSLVLRSRRLAMTPLAPLVSILAGQREEGRGGERRGRGAGRGEGKGGEKEGEGRGGKREGNRNGKDAAW